MSETQKKAYLVAAAIAILHNGKRYEQGDKIELTDEEAEKNSLYIVLDDTEKKAQEAAKKSGQADKDVQDNKDKDEQ